jgi:hypothetical protein
VNFKILLGKESLAVYQDGLVSADYFGYFAQALEAKLQAGQQRPPFVGLMSNGTSGNTGALAGDGKKRPPFGWIEASGQILAADALRILDRIEHRADVTLAIKQQSPLDATFTIQIANGYGGYLPTPEQHALGGYETWPARSSFLEVNAETKIRAEVLRLLRMVRGEGPGA